MELRTRALSAQSDFEPPGATETEQHIRDLRRLRDYHGGQPLEYRTAPGPRRMSRPLGKLNPWGLLALVLIVGSISTGPIYLLKTSAPPLNPTASPSAGAPPISLAWGLLIGVVVLLSITGLAALTFRAFVKPSRAFRGVERSAIEDPLNVVSSFMKSTRQRYRSTWVVLLIVALAHALLTVGALVTAIVLVTGKGTGTGAVFGSGGVGGVFMGVAWHPWERVNKASQLASTADALNMGLHLRVAMVMQITDVEKRQQEVWKVVLEFTKELKDNA
jgi:hypothetical protein